MKKFLSLIALALVACTIAYAGGGNILASGEITIAATITPSTNTQTVSLSNITGKEWAQVFAVVVQNNTDFATTTTVARVDLDVSSDFLAGRDPSAVYEGCVIRKTGQAPRQPLYMIPDWKG